MKNKSFKKTKWFFEQYQSPKGINIGSWKISWLWIRRLFFFLLFIIALATFNFQFNYHGWEYFQQNLWELFQINDVNSQFPSYGLWSLSWYLLWKTIKLAFAGTLFGFVMAFFSAVFAQKEFSNKTISWIIKILEAIVRSFPILALIFAFQQGFSKEIAAFLIYWWFSWLWIGKYIDNLLKSISLDRYYQELKNGQNRFFAFKNGVLPLINNRLLLYYFNSLESNVRWTTVISAAGVLGIGTLIVDSSRNLTQGFKYISIPFLVLLIFILSIELVIFIFNNYILKIKSRPFQKKDLNKNYNVDWKRVIKIVFVLATIIISIISLIEIKWDFSKTIYFQKYFEQLFNPKWSLWASSDYLENPWFNLLSLLQQTYIICYASFYLIFYVTLLYNERIFKPYCYVINKIIINFIRILPLALLIILFLPLFANTKSLVIFLMIINIIASSTKNISEAINKIDWNQYYFLKKEGWSQWRLINTFIWHSISKTYYFAFIFVIENTFRSLITLGLFGTSTIGEKIITYSEPGSHAQSISTMAAYVWVIFLVLLTWNIIWLIPWSKIFKVPYFQQQFVLQNNNHIRNTKS